MHGHIIFVSNAYVSHPAGDSVDELDMLRIRFEQHAQTFKDWARTGGPVNPLWVRETSHLRNELHRAQCRAARRIFNTEQEPGARCLGAFLVYREQRRRERETHDLPRWQQEQQSQQWQQNQQQRGQQVVPGGQVGGEPVRQQLNGNPAAAPVLRASLESLVPTCNSVGKFQRFGDSDIAFACDFCDGFIVWEDLRTMPAVRTPLAPGDTQPNWQARAPSLSSPDSEDRTVVFAPLAIANHQPPDMGNYMARLTCPYCEQSTFFDQGGDGEDELRYEQDEAGFPDLRSFQEHLEWSHTALPVPALSTTTSKCSVM